MKVKLIKAFLAIKAAILAIPALLAIREGHRITPEEARRIEGESYSVEDV